MLLDTGGPREPGAKLRASKICMLTASIQSVNTTAIHFQFAITTTSTKAQAKPTNAIHRGKIELRNPMVQVEIMNKAPSS
jgi:hypothetical protein